MASGYTRQDVEKMAEEIESLRNQLTTPFHQTTD